MPNSGPIIFVDDEGPMRQAVSQWLGLSGFELLPHDQAATALSLLSKDYPGLVVTDLKMPGMDGMELLRRVQGIDSEIPVIVITGHGDVETAVEAMRLGAYDFIEKPFAPERLLDVVRRAAEKRQLVTENRRLRGAVNAQSLNSRIIGTSRIIEELRTTVAELAATGVSVILYGETGVGKDLVARCLHDFGRRRDGNYVAVNCVAIPETMFESEFFGHEAGAFTSAAKARIGKMQHASGGTLFLDEIDGMPLAMQGKLLRALQERVVERLGSNRSTSVDLRPIAASKINLRTASAEGRFRPDLYYRLSVVELVVPPLRDRLEDIPLLFEYFAAGAAEAHGRALRPIPTGSMNALMSHNWPGNVRELRNAAERYAVGIGSLVEPQTETRELSLNEQVETFERALIERSLAESGGSVSAVVKKLGVPRRTLSEKMGRLGLSRRRFTGSDDERNSAAPNSPNGEKPPVG